MKYRFVTIALAGILAVLLSGCNRGTAAPPASRESAPTRAVVRATSTTATLPAATPQNTATPRPSATPTPVFFRESFDGEPEQPRPFEAASWDVAVHNRNRDFWYELEPVDAGHGPGCEAPDQARHTVETYQDAVYLCRQHLMTTINGSDYALIYLTPPYMVDFGEEEAVIRWDLSTLQRSDRDWWDLWITPYEDNLVTPLQEWLPDLTGEPRRALQIQLNEGSVIGRLVENHDAQQLPRAETEPYQAFLEPSETRRDTFELRLSDDHIRFGMPEYDVWWIDTDLELDWHEGVVQFGHHSYSPTKQGGTPGTWHWDNIFIQPAVPFTILQADRRYVAPSDATQVSFPEAAPDDAHLRFSGIGKELEVRFDNGPWQAALLQKQERVQEEHFSSYWMPIPAGTTSVSFRGEEWFGGDWHVRDITIWARPDQATPPTTVSQ